MSIHLFVIVIIKFVFFLSSYFFLLCVQLYITDFRSPVLSRPILCFFFPQSLISSNYTNRQGWERER